MTNMKKKPDEYWKKKLTPEQYKILREKETEIPFTGEYYQNDKKGVYKCAACGVELFSSETKFKSGSGWPSFFGAVDDKKIELFQDHSHGMERVEARCANCGGHLGHVWDESPTPTGKYYCINSACLAFEEKK